MKESSRASLKILITIAGVVVLLLWFLSHATGIFHYAIGGFASEHLRSEAPKHELMNLSLAEWTIYMAGAENDAASYTADLKKLIANGYRRNPSMVVFLTVVDIDLGTEKMQGFWARANQVDGRKVYSYSSFDGGTMRLMRGEEPLKGQAGPWEGNGPPPDFGGVNFQALVIKYPLFSFEPGHGRPAVSP